MPLTNLRAAPLSASVIEITRAAAAASGDVAYTGAGFKPRAVLFVYFGDAGPGTTLLGFGIGFAGTDLTTQDGIYNRITDLFYVNSPTTIILLQGAGADIQYAELLSFDADGFTLRWTKGGVGSSSPVVIRALCFG